MDSLGSAGARRILLAALWFCLPVVGAGSPVRFDVPAQSAASALLAFASQSGVEVLFSFRELSAVRSTAVVGAFEPPAALSQLLAGTGFVGVPNASGKYTVVRAPDHRSQIRGTIVSDVDDTPVAGAVVRLDAAPTAVRVGSNGRFFFDAIDPGRHSIHVTADGYRTTAIPDVPIAEGRAVELGAIPLTPGADDPQQSEPMMVNAGDLRPAAEIVALDALVVTPSRYLLSPERGTVAATLTGSDLLALPQLGEDLYRAISHLPGLAADDYTAKFWVRGAPYDKVLARLDGVDLVEPFHLKDIDSTLSILDLETISRMSLYTGGFTAEYGDRTTGVLTMETDRPTRAEPRTTIGLSLTGIRAATRGTARGGRSRWLGSARTGYPAVALGMTDGANVIKPHYYDVFGKWEFDLTPDHTVALHALHAGDTMEFRDESGPLVNSRYGSDYLWVRWRGSFGPDLEAETVLSATRLDWCRNASGQRNQNYAVALDDTRELRTAAVRQDWTARLSERVLLRAGVNAATGDASYGYYSRHDEPTVTSGTLTTETFSRSGHTDPSGSALGVYGTLRLQPWRPFTVETGVRYDRHDYGAGADVTPRLNAAWSRGRTTLRAAWGEYAQAQGLHELSFGDGERTFGRSERAEQRIIGIEHRLNGGVNLRAEAYERIVRRPRPHWENVVDALDVIGELGYDRTGIEPIGQRAQGVELIAEQRSRPHFAWSATYALARSEETLRSGAVIPRARDQRHTVYLDASYRPNDRWQISAAWQYHTGWPATPVVFTSVGLANGGAAVFGVPGALYSIQLPDYHRLDFRVQRQLRLKHGQVRLYLDVFNAYNRRNSIGYRYAVTVQGSEVTRVDRETDHNLFPMLPSVGLAWDF